MFGWFKSNKKKYKKKEKKLKQERERFEQERNQFNANRPVIEKQIEDQNAATTKQIVDERAGEEQKARQEGRAEGKKYAEEFLSRDVQGLTPEQRKAMQYEASQRINRETQAAERKLLGEQGRRNIGGKSGVAFAQQQELRRLGNEAQGQSTRDLDKLNADLALKKLAAMFNIEQGEAAQRNLDRQAARDELELSQEKKRQRYLEEQFNRLFSRV